LLSGEEVQAPVEDVPHAPAHVMAQVRYTLENK